MKKADITWEAVAKLILALVFLLFITIIIFKYKDKMLSVFGTIKNYFRFG